MRLPALLLILACLAPLPAVAQVVSEKAEAVAIVVYPQTGAGQFRGMGQGLVMVSERRTVDLPAGPSKISFRGVAEGIVAQTVALQGLPGGIKEQNFDYQLLTPGALIAASEGRNVTLVRTNKVTGRAVEERARVVSAQNGAVLDIDGRIEALRCSALPEKVVFDDLPPGYSDKPTLSVEVVAPAAVRATVILSYLATGVSWSANYVARLAPDSRSLTLSSWITISNRSSAAFADAPIQVLAGRLERTPNETVPVVPPRVRFFPSCWPINSGRRFYARAPAPAPPPRPGVSELSLRSLGSGRSLVTVNGRRLADDPELEDLGDYKLYTLPQPTTLAAYQTKQLRMFEREDVDMRRVHRVTLASGLADVEGRYWPVAVVAEMENKKAKGLGLALPAGTVTVFEEGRQGRARFAGEDRVRDTAEGLPLEFTIAQDSRVQAAARIVSRDSRSRSVEVTITNAQDEPALVQLRETDPQGRFKVVKESLAHGMKYGAPEWSFTLGAHQQRVVTYTLTWPQD